MPQPVVVGIAGGTFMVKRCSGWQLAERMPTKWRVGRPGGVCLSAVPRAMDRTRREYCQAEMAEVGRTSSLSDE